MSSTSTSASPFTSAVLLAAGASRRMRSLKALLDWQGRPLIMHQITALRQAGADEVVVVLGYRADELQARIGVNSEVYAVGGVRCVVNGDYARGKTTSIIAGVSSIAGVNEVAGRGGNAGVGEVAGGGAVGGAGQSVGPIILLNVDQPRRVDTIRRILEAHWGNPEALITIPTYGGKGGHPIVVSRTLRPELLALSESTQGMRAVTERHRDATQRVELGAPELLWDVNTPEQYRAAVAAAGDAGNWG